MKKFNLFKEIISVNRSQLLNALNSTKEFGITIKGEIKFKPFGDKDILIYEGKYSVKPTNALILPKPLSLAEILGKNYQIVEDNDRVLIKAFSSWQALIGINIPKASYDDTTADGVAEFSNDALEAIGWNATEFNINYRTLVQLMEEKCEGTLICIEQEEPFQFSGLGFISDDDHAYKVLFEYCQTEIKKMMEEDPLFAKENLNDDEKEAAEFFKLL